MKRLVEGRLISGGSDQCRKVEQLTPLEVWCRRVKADHLDALQLFSTPFWGGTCWEWAWEGEGGKDGAVAS